MPSGLVTCGLHEPFPMTSTRCILTSVSLQNFRLKTFDFESGDRIRQSPIKFDECAYVQMRVFGPVRKDFSYCIVAAFNLMLHSLYGESTPWEMHLRMVS